MCGIFGYCSFLQEKVSCFVSTTRNTCSIYRTGRCWVVERSVGREGDGLLHRHPFCLGGGTRCGYTTMEDVMLERAIVKGGSRCLPIALQGRASRRERVKPPGGYSQAFLRFTMSSISVLSFADTYDAILNRTARRSVRSFATVSLVRNTVVMIPPASESMETGLAR